MSAQRLVIYVSHPLTPTDAEIRAIGVPSDGATEFTLRVFALQENIDKAKRWLAWLRVAFQATTFIAPWIANIEACGRDGYVASMERGGSDALATIDRCDGIVLCGGRISAGMQREIDHAWANQNALGNRSRVWDLTCAKNPDPPAGMRPHRNFASWAIPYERREPTVHDRREPTP